MTENWLNNLSSKEKTEWSNFWYDEANTEAKRRVLLVGDSVARQIRRTLSRTLECPVDLFGSSAALRDQMYWNQWNCFFENGLYKYDVIFVWVGNHSRRSEDGTTLFTEYDYNRFKKDFSYLIERCLSHSSKVVILSTLHMFKNRKSNKYIEILRRKFMIKPKEYFNLEENVVVEGKNLIMEAIAEKYNLTFYDIDNSLLHSKYWHVDIIHYVPESNLFVCEKLKQLL